MVEGLILGLCACSTSNPVTNPKSCNMGDIGVQACS